MQPAKLQTAKATPDFLVFTEIGIIAQLANNRLARALPADLTAPQFAVLNHFARRGGAETPAQLAAAFEVAKGTVTHTLQQLKAKGYVAVVPHPADRRKKCVSLTPEGLIAHDRAASVADPVLRQLREAFTDAEFENALPFLRALRVWLDENRNSGEMGLAAGAVGPRANDGA